MCQAEENFHEEQFTYYFFLCDCLIYVEEATLTHVYKVEPQRRYRWHTLFYIATMAMEI